MNVKRQACKYCGTDLKHLVKDTKVAVGFFMGKGKWQTWFYRFKLLFFIFFKQPSPPSLLPGLSEWPSISLPPYLPIYRITPLPWHVCIVSPFFLLLFFFLMPQCITTEMSHNTENRVYNKHKYKSSIMTEQPVVIGNQTHTHTHMQVEGGEWWGGGRSTSYD